MSCKDLKYSKLKNLNEIDFNFGSSKKNELESLSHQILKELLSSKQRVVYVFNSSIREYIQQVKLERVISTLYKQQTSVSHKLSELHKKLQTLKAEEENKDSSRNIQRVLMYEQNLAIKVEPTGDLPISEEEVAVTFYFSHVNESIPEDTCSLVLIITNGNRYKAGNCHPSIVGMEDLISTLNKTNDLHHFIVNVRKKFKQSFTKAV